MGVDKKPHLDVHPISQSHNWALLVRPGHSLIPDTIIMATHTFLARLTSQADSSSSAYHQIHSESGGGGGPKRKKTGVCS